MIRTLPVLFLLLALALLPAEASAQHYVYYHQYHPVPEAFGGGFCEQEEVHPHEYAPVDLDWYQVVEGVYYYIGDAPDEVFEEEEIVWYEDHHPVPVLWGGGICYIVGPHRHWWRPHVHLHGYYHVIGGRYVYRGPWGATYHPHRRIRPVRAMRAVRKVRQLPPLPPSRHRAQPRPAAKPRPHYKLPAWQQRTRPAATRPAGHVPGARQPARRYELQKRRPPPRSRPMRVHRPPAPRRGR